MKKLSENIRRVGLIANADKASTAALVRQAARLIQKSRRTVVLDETTAALSGLKVETCADAAALTRQADLLMVFGGDGTMLRVARETAGSRTPILGINAGALGFLTDVQAHQLPLALKQIWAGETILESRPLIEAGGTASGRRLEWRALNDFVITRGAAPRLIELEVSVDAEVLTRYRCDGLIVCSPTGSTAYSLSAGGPIIFPSVAALAITPICPHMLTNRPVIVSDTSVIQIVALGDPDSIFLTVDGQVGEMLQPEDRVICRSSSKAIHLIRPPKAMFFDVLRAKLKWGER